MSPTASPVEPNGDTSKCPSGGPCNRLPADCITCSYQEHKLSNCTYGRPATFTCKPNRGVHCTVSSEQQNCILNFHFLHRTVCVCVYVCVCVCSHTCRKLRTCWQCGADQTRCSSPVWNSAGSSPRERSGSQSGCPDTRSTLSARAYLRRER